MADIIICDDHAVVRKGLKQILDGTPDLRITDEAISGYELLEKIRKNKFDMIILDIGLPDIDGLDTLKEIKAIMPLIPVLVFTMNPEEQYAIRMLKAGAHGYVNKESDSSELLKAIRTVSGGRKYVSPEVAEILAERFGIMDDMTGHEQLSDREFQVMCLIATGKTVTEIASKLNLSINTISTYRNRVLEKMKLKNNSEITHYAIKNRLV